MRRELKYPETIAFRTTKEFREQLEDGAKRNKMSLSEYLQNLLKKTLVTESSEYLKTLMVLASLRQQIGQKGDEDWVRMKINTHRWHLEWDAHHGYNEEQAILDMKDDIDYLKSRLFPKK